ncbi:Zinc finger transcription factor 1 [Pleurostoma richardsiae]|uniref:Zinc finger transcription factor 1 n=1 Tax=Pleurostoma richardsiae TaxID=41990 RepID=A0AA38VVQ8_9PEZI|nr:Zinc finger transcription factor 1 [Pleurostoma richardsiae]
MSSRLSQSDIKPDPAADGDFSRPAADSEGQLIQADPDTIQAFSLDAPDDSVHVVASPHTLLDSSHFGDFSFPFQPAPEEISMVALEDEHGAHLFAATGPPSVSSMPDRQGSIASITAHVANFHDADSAQRLPSLDASDDGSQDDNGHGGNALDEPMSDEFGLTANGPGDGTDFAGKSKEDKADAAPAWSELKTKAGKERKRLPLACIACRRKKIRCSGEKPACKHCLRSRMPCVYKVTARKAAPRTDYMAMLDKRLKRMEERIIKIVPKTEQDATASSVPRAVVKPAIPGTLAAGKGGAKKRGADEAFGADLDNWAKAPAKTKLDGPSGPATVLAQESEETKLLQEGAEVLPPRDIQEHLAEVFFENIYGQAYHVLHKPSFMRKLRAGTLPPVLILSVCAVSARFSTHPKLNTGPNFLRGEEWASAARDIVMKRYEWPNITILTCLLILGLHEFGTCHGGRSWALGGQAIRMAFALQLHKDLEQDPLRLPGSAQLSFIDREIRRRTMWACFLMDRFNSSGTDRPTFIKEETIKVPLPIKEKYFQLDMPGPTETLQGEVLHPVSADDGELADAKDNMGVAAYMIRVIALWGRIINYLNQGGKELDEHPMWSPDSEYSKLIKQTDDVVADLPESLQYSHENLHLHDTEGMANQFLFLHISIQQNILFMNRFAVSPPNGSSQQDVPKTFVTKAGAKAFAAANRVSELLKDAESYFVTAPFVGYCAFLSSTVHIFGIFSGNPAIEATSKRNLATNVKFLSKMKRYWGMFHWMSENLREQYRTCADAARKGNPASESSTSPIFQYGDWFDRYPHGVSHSDFIDPASYKRKERGDDAVLEQKPELHTVEEFFTTLSPRSQEARDAQGRPTGLKRKSVAKKGGSVASRSDQHQLEPLLTDLTPTAEHLQRLQQRRAFGSPLGGQTSGPTSFNPLTIPQSHNGSNYHALSPISPMGQFPQHPSTPFYPPDILSLSLAQQANGILPQLDRQLVFGAYAGLDPGGGILEGVAGWEGEGGGGGSGNPIGAHGRPGRQSRSVTDPGHPGHPDPLAAFGHGHESSAWFMPFNMEPPEIGPDLGPGGVGSLDGFAQMFGASMTTPGGVNGRLHRAGH